MDTQTLSTLVGGAIAFIAAVVGYLIYKVWPTFGKLKDLLDDIQGEPARPGVPARPGIMENIAILKTDFQSHGESLARLETEQAAQGEKLDSVHHEVNFNHGGSVKDSVIRAENDVKTVKAEVMDIKDSVAEMTAKLSSHLNHQPPTQSITVDVHPPANSN